MLRHAPHSDPSTVIHITSAGTTYGIPSPNVIEPLPATPEERHQSGFWLDISGLELDPSLYCLTTRYTEASQSHTLLFFISGAGASDAAPVLVIGFTQDGVPYKVLERNQLDITSFEISPDGTPLIIGKATLSQVMTGDGGNGSKAPYATTYDPFSVFIVHAGAKAIYSLEASRAYNEKHYVWAGPHSREDYAVVYNLPGHYKPFGATASRAIALVSQRQ